MSISTNIPPCGLPPRAFSVSDAARRMGISRATLFREINPGRLTALKVGSKTIVTDAAIEAWLARSLSAVRPRREVGDHEQPLPRLP